MMVVTGSVMLGDSVRNTLVQRVTERLGQSQTVISSGQGLLSDSLLTLSELQGAHGYLLAEGFVASEGRMLPVMVWGTDEDSIPKGRALINETLSDALGTEQHVVVHLPSNNMVPSGSLFVSQRYTTTMRLQVNGIKTAENGGNRWLHNEQMRPMNVFVNRQEMAEVMGTDGRINLILSDRTITEDAFRRCWSPSYSGIRLQGQDSVCVTSERVFLPERVVEALRPQAVYEAYFVNRMAMRGVTANDINAIPYSFVTATTELTGDDVVLSDVAARRLGAAVGDTIEMDYYVVKELKRLDTRTHRFVVKEVVPLSTFINDRRLMADFPGLSNVERCTDWDSDLPIDMSKIKKEDEDYWERYRQTPKALVSWEAVKEDWSNAYGVATAVTNPATLNLSPEMMGITVASPREEATRLAAGGTDFTSLFLALGFFILVSAVLLIMNPLQEMYHLRREEIRLYATMGFNKSLIRRLLFKEALPVMLAASPIGVIAGCIYAVLSLWLLSGTWRGATHTEDFSLYINPVTVGIAWVAGLLVSLTVVWLAQKSPMSPRSRVSAKSSGLHTTLRLWTVCGVFVVLLLLNFFLLHSMILFVVCGFLWIVCAAGVGQWLVTRQTPAAQQQLTRTSLCWYALRAHLPQHRGAFWTLATGLFMVFAVGLNRPDADQSSNWATGGYKMYAESRVPIQYDLNSPEVRRHLKLDKIGGQVRFLQIQKHRQDEASCLNLNKVTTPTVLAMEKDEMAVFGIDTTVFADDRIQDGSRQDFIPVVLDEEALMWSVMKRVGDTLHYVAGDGSTVNVLIAGSYPMGVLHGHALMLRQHFSRLWPEESGNSVLLANDDVGEELSTALADYGMSTMSVAERMEQFLEVTDTYLSIFMALGGLGLLLGILSLLVVLRKHLAARQQEIAHYDTLGFSMDQIARMLRWENKLPTLYAILTGAVGSIISISASMNAIHADTWLMAVLLLLLILSITILFINYIINPKRIRK